MYKSVLVLVALASPTVVTACEGECIVGITNAFLSNYSTPMSSAFEDIVGQFVAQLLPERRYSSPPMFFIKPILDDYRKNAYNRLENSIFPSKFHGKCQRPDPNFPNEPPKNPPGCPNPDCPVICGTPGSLVHFYPTLRCIVFNETRDHLQTIATPGTEPYQAVEKKIMSEIEKGNKLQYHGGTRSNIAGTRAPRQRRLAHEHAKKEIQRIMSTIPGVLEKKCGGKATEDVNALPNCSWDERMKQFILSYP